ncbi:MAG: phosphoglycolate phosphatase [Rhodothermales bacterium]
MKKFVLLFDIDGTLLLAPGLGKTFFEEALQEVSGRSASSEGVKFAGRTDRSLAREMLNRAGYPFPGLENAIHDVLDAYARRLVDSIEPSAVNVLPGVVELLETLAPRETLHLGLLTGNLELTGWAKLRAAGLDGYFGFGAFGSDHEDRNALPSFALERANALAEADLGFESVVVIGDTEHDILCGKAVGALTVGVCTGYVSRKSLEDTSPDVLLEDFNAASAFMALIQP